MCLFLFEPLLRKRFQDSSIQRWLAFTPQCCMVGSNVYPITFTMHDIITHWCCFGELNRCVYTFTAAYGMSFGPIGWVLPNEVFSLSMRSKGVSLSTASNWINNCVYRLFFMLNSCPVMILISCWKFSLVLLHLQCWRSPQCMSALLPLCSTSSILHHVNPCLVPHSWLLHVPAL